MTRQEELKREWEEEQSWMESLLNKVDKPHKQTPKREYKARVVAQNRPSEKMACYRGDLMACGGTPFVYVGKK